MKSQTLIKTCLVILAFAALSIGLPAAFAPEDFYRDYPFFTSWIDLLPPYNEHLISDVGGLYIGFGVLFVWALFKPSKQLILPVAVAWLVTQVIHLAFHVGHLAGYDTADAIAQTAGLTVVTLVPIIMISALVRE
ncbi:MAG: hypothetical protein JJE10_09470 [Thermoleophilia bacterium]|nr:hypothetical protein [Thermoleophilia bacterium]